MKSVKALLDERKQYIEICKLWGDGDYKNIENLRTLSQVIQDSTEDTIKEMFDMLSTEKGQKELEKYLIANRCLDYDLDEHICKDLTRRNLVYMQPPVALLECNMLALCLAAMTQTGSAIKTIGLLLKESESDGEEVEITQSNLPFKQICGSICILQADKKEIEDVSDFVGVCYLYGEEDIADKVLEAKYKDKEEQDI